MASSRNRGKQRLIIVGIDGATCTVIEPLVKAGKLPNLGKLIESGSMVKLLSTIHPMSPQAWTSFHTGVSPWKHGVFGFLSLDIGQPVSLLRWRDIQVISMVEMLDRAGICTIWNNLVGAYPFPKLRNGIVAGGRMTPSKADLIYPEKLQDDLQRLFPSGYARISLEALVEDGEISETGLLSRLLVHTEHQTRLTTHLMKSHPWDLCFVMFDATDIGQHTFWRYFDVKHPSYSPNAPDVLKRAITTIFRRIDDSIGELIQVAPENTNVMILSDHGFVPLCATVNLNGFLARAGYTVPVRSIDRYSPSTLVRGISSRLGRSLPNGNDQELEPIYQSRKIKWKKTSVYTHGYMGNLFVNLKGREPEGCIFPKDYEKVLQRVIEDLYRWKNPVTGDPLVRTAHRSPASIMHQHHLRGVPDLILEWFDYRYAGIHPGSYWCDFEDVIPGFSYNILRSADHSLEGVLICAGPSFEPSWNNGAVHKVSIWDMTPIIMALMGLPLPDHFDGSVPTGLLRSRVAGEMVHRKQSERYDVSVHKSAHSDEEQTEIADLLRGLGYLE